MAVAEIFGSFAHRVIGLVNRFIKCDQFLSSIRLPIKLAMLVVMMICKANFKLNSNQFKDGRLKPMPKTISTTTKYHIQLNSLFFFFLAKVLIFAQSKTLLYTIQCKFRLPYFFLNENSIQ